MAESSDVAAVPPTLDDDASDVLRVTARQHGDDLVVLTAHGEIDMSNTWVLESELARHEHVPRLVVDLSEIRFCGVPAARLLHTAATRSAVTGQHLEVVDNPAVSRLLTMTGLADDIPRRASVDLEYEQAERSLRDYAHQVATAAGSGPESTVSELEPDPGIYIALSSRSAFHPGQDTALLWTDAHGWSVALETGDRDVHVLDYLGPELLPSPPVVARFATEVLTRPAGARPPQAPDVDATNLLGLLRAQRSGAG